MYTQDKGKTKKKIEKKTFDGKYQFFNTFNLIKNMFRKYFQSRERLH